MASREGRAECPEEHSQSKGGRFRETVRENGKGGLAPPKRETAKLGKRVRQAGLPAEAWQQHVGKRVGGSNSVVESQPSKLLVAGSIPVSRSRLPKGHGI